MNLDMNQECVLQNRWSIKGNRLVYYGMRVKPYFLKNHIRISSKARSILEQMPKPLDETEMKTISRLIKQQIVVNLKDLKQTPKTLSEEHFCKQCVANDFIITGLELNSEGLCPMCETAEETKDMHSILPLKTDIEKNPSGRFDVAVFYTGGKDSSYLLYYLAKVKNLRVIAYTWDMPFMTQNAKQSIENAKKKLTNVEFVSRQMSINDLKQIYRHLYSTENNPCACPSLAYALFYPDMVDEGIPYFVLGNEPVQMLGIYYNRLTPKAGYNLRYHRLLNVLISVGRVLTLRKPLKLGQMHTLMTMRQLAYGDSKIKTWAGYNSELVTHVSDALRSLPSMVKPLRRAIRRSNWSGNIPRLVHIDFDEIFDGGYNWIKTKDLLVKELGWVGPVAKEKSLHTSCLIETCKEQSQFKRFYMMEFENIPFSAIEISLASSRKNSSREEAMEELEKHLGFSLDEVPSCQYVKDFLNQKS